MLAITVPKLPVVAKWQFETEVAYRLAGFDHHAAKFGATEHQCGGGVV